MANALIGIGRHDTTSLILRSDWPRHLASRLMEQSLRPSPLLNSGALIVRSLAGGQAMSRTFRGSWIKDAGELIVDPIVETTNGKVVGTTLRGVHAFRGVRYGDATGGVNRFRPPRPPAKWRGVAEARSYGASAPQLPCPENTDPFFAWYSMIEAPSEDCLFLNVFTPGLEGTTRPVMVWIHGGGWTHFSGTAPGFDGSSLAKAEEVVVVTINHRLGVFGHLLLEEGDERFADSGNCGMLDVVAALEWVRDNVEAFGGDTGNVTVFGESGGGSKVAALLSMPRAAGLFHRAVVQSSGSGMFLADQAESRASASALARELELQSLNPEALQAVSMEAILRAARTAGGPYRGMLDGRSFVRHPFEHAAPGTSSTVPVMFGCTMTEGTYYMRGDHRNFDLGMDDVRRRLGRFLEADGHMVDGIVGAYREAYPGASPSRLLFLCFSDYMFKRATYRMAALKAADRGAPAFAYHFEWQTPIEGGRMGSPHTAEVPFIFGTASSATACVGDGDDIPDMTRKMMASWAAFARRGNPSNDLVPDWQPYGVTKRTMILDRECGLENDPGGVARATLGSLPFFGYGHSIPAVLKD